jgi:hypothetical protein
MSCRAVVHSRLSTPCNLCVLNPAQGACKRVIGGNLPTSTGTWEPVSTLHYMSVWCLARVFSLAVTVFSSCNTTPLMCACSTLVLMVVSQACKIMCKILSVLQAMPGLLLQSCLAVLHNSLFTLLKKLLGSGFRVLAACVTDTRGTCLQQRGNHSHTVHRVWKVRSALI